MRIPLTITATGFAGVGPLELEYSTGSTSEWSSYTDTIVTGTADYEFSISQSSTDDIVFNVRVFSQDMTSGTTSMTCAGVSCVENIVDEPTANGNGNGNGGGSSSSSSGSGNNNQDSEGLSGGAIAGIVIAGVVVVAAAIVVGVFLFKKKRRKSGVGNEKAEP
jgi:hypothetical protein